MTVCVETVERECFKPGDDTEPKPVSVSGKLKSLIFQHDVTDTDRETGYVGQTPSYGQLCIVAMFFNPLLGGLAFYLNHRGKKSFRSRKMNKSFFQFWCAICLSTCAIFLTVGGVLLIPTLRPLPVAIKHGCKRPYTESYMDKYHTYFDIDKAIFCGIIEHPRLMKVLDKYISQFETNNTQIEIKHIFFTEPSPAPSEYKEPIEDHSPSEYKEPTEDDSPSEFKQPTEDHSFEEGSLHVQQDPILLEYLANKTKLENIQTKQ